MDGILSIQSGVVFDESIAQYELHTHQPYSSLSFNNNDEIRITIQNQDLCVLPSRSYIRIYGRVLQPNGTAVAKTDFVNNGFCHLFDEIRYEMNGVEIDKSRNVGMTSLMKGWPSFTPTQAEALRNAGWENLDEANSSTKTSEGYFEGLIP